MQDALAINFALPLGAVSEIVTIQGGAPLVNTESAAVSTVIDRKFVENLPEKEIALRLNLTRDGVAGQLKRIRRGLRIAFGDAE